MAAQRSPFRSLQFVLLAALALLGALAFGWSAYGTQMNQYATDLFFRVRGAQKAGAEQIVIVAIDDQTLANFGNVPLNRALVANALMRICRGRPRVVGLDLWFPEASNPESDQALAAALQACPNIVLASSLVKGDPGDPERWVDPLPEFAQFAAAIAHVHADPDLDGISRQILLAKSAGGQRRWALALEALRVHSGHDGPVLEDERSLVMGSHIIPASRQSQRTLTINYAGGEGVFPRYSFRQLIEGEIAAQVFYGKAVLVGVTAQGVGDRLFTPLSSSGVGMPGVEIHANVLRMMMTGRFLHSLRETTALAAIAGIAAVVALALRLLTGGWLALTLAVVGAVTHAAPYFLFSRRDLVTPAFSFSLAFWGPLLVCGVFQYLTVWRRYVQADATSRRIRDRLDLVSHEMRSPLTAIQGSSEVMSRYPLDEAKRQELAELIHRESKRLATMVERFLDVERLEAGEIELRREPVPLRMLVGRAIERVRPLATRKNIQIQTAAGAEARALGDSELLEFALYNLLSNAVKYSPEGSVVEVAIGSDPAQRMAFLEVSDEGPGIAPAEQERIFDRFYRSESARQSGQSGLGLGLSIVKEIARHHGGSVLVSSVPGQGSRFSLTLPLGTSGSGRTAT